MANKKAKEPKVKQPKVVQKPQVTEVPQETSAVVVGETQKEEVPQESALQAQDKPQAALFCHNLTFQEAIAFSELGKKIKRAHATALSNGSDASETDRLAHDWEAYN